MNLSNLKRNFLLFALLFSSALIYTGCTPEEPDDENEEEVITTLIYTLTDANGNTAVLSFVDLDGDGPDLPVVTADNLAANTTYTGSIQFRNDEENEDITAEVQEEDEDHQVFYESTIAGISVSYDDADADGNPVGLATILTTGDAGTGNITITLRHEPVKDATGVSDGDIANAEGETDIEVVFTGVAVQ